MSGSVRSNRGLDIRPASVLVEKHFAVLQREEGKIAALTNIESRVPLVSALANND